VWLTTQAGVSRLRDGQVRNYTMADGLSARNALTLYQERTGRICVGTYNGADCLAGERFVNILSFPKSGALPIGLEQSGTLYFSAASKGILRIENNQPVTVVPGLVPGEMRQTEQGDLWLFGDEILRAPLSILHRSYGRDDPLDFAAFGPADGLNTTAPSAGQPISAITPDGRLWFATTQGLAMIDLPRLPRTDRKPTIYVREITVGRDIQPAGPELVLPPGTHHLELQFDAIELSSPEKIRLQYRLDGVDSEWLDAPSPAHAIYSNMPPGRHAFHIRACNREGIWDGRAHPDRARPA
jgi:hypothetical protein